MKITACPRSGDPRAARSVVLLACLTLAACGASRRDVAEIYGGDGPLSVLERPASVRAWRLDPEHRPAQPHEPEPAAFPALQGPVELAPEDGERLGALLAAPGTYVVPVAAKACAPRYGLRLSFTGDAGTVDVVLCFECSLLQAWRDGAYAGTGHVDPGRGRLARAALAAFPDDEGLRGWAEEP